MPGVLAVRIRWLHIILAAVALATLPSLTLGQEALSHESLGHEAFGHDAHAHHTMGGWNTTLRLWMGLALAAMIYGGGLYRLWKKAGVGKGVARWQACCYAGGWLTVFVALVSPLDSISGELFAVHMVQHLLLILVAAPLLVSGAPIFVAIWLLPQKARIRVAGWMHPDGPWRQSWDVVSQPLLVWSAFFATLWLWHIPGLYEAALRSQLVHDIQHLAFLSAAGLTWWIVLNPMGRLKLSRGASVMYLFTTSLHAGALGVLITFSPRAWYGYYESTTEAWGFTLLQDQQLAGIIMWMPAAAVYIGLAAMIFALWIRDSESAVQRIERHAQSHERSAVAAERLQLLRESG
jgi:putative membrane protein